MHLTSRICFYCLGHLNSPNCIHVFPEVQTSNRMKNSSNSFNHCFKRLFFFSFILPVTMLIEHYIELSYWHCYFWSFIFCFPNLYFSRRKFWFCCWSLHHFSCLESCIVMLHWNTFCWVTIFYPGDLEHCVCTSSSIHC